MIKLIKRTSDKKYLQSLSGDTWVDSYKDAYQMTYFECETVKTELLKTYQPEELKEVIDFGKSKHMTEEEKNQLMGMLTPKFNLTKK